MAALTYEKVGGNLPKGLTLKQINGKARVYGMLLWYSEDGPVWNEAQASFLGTYLEGETVNLPPMDVTPMDGRTITDFQLVGSMATKYSSLPFGLVLNGVTGVISGKILEIGDYAANPWMPDEQPIWNTSEGQLGDFSLKQTVNLTISASPKLGTAVNEYSLISGFLPFGLHLNPDTGVIQGVVADHNASGPLVSLSPAPKWNTIPGSIGNFDEKDNISIQLDATPLLGTAITEWEVVKGALPWGLHLNPETGVIAGEISETLISPLEPAFHHPGPLWTVDENLGSFPVNVPMNVPIQAIAANGRTVDLYYIAYHSSKVLPWGVYLDTNTGVIKGTPKDTGTYAITVVVEDNTKARTTRDFTFTIV